MRRSFVQVLACLLVGAWQGAGSAMAQPGLGEGWAAVSSPHFTVYTNADPKRGEEIAESLERFRAVFAQLSPELELRSPAPTKILAFRNAESYAAYKTTPDGNSSRILGQFLSHPDGNYITLDAGTRLVGSFTVIYHEYVHYFVRHNFPGIPRWFNEGLAEYYSTFTTDGEQAFVGKPVERHVRWLQHNSELALDQILTVTGSASGHRDGQAGRFYAVSWALVHYLLSGDAERLDRAADFFLRLRVGEDAEDAFEASFDIRLSELEKQLSRYVASSEMPSAAISLSRLPSPKITVRAVTPEDMLFHLGDLLAHMRRERAAEQHFQLALDHWSDHPDTHTGLALVRDLQSRFEEAELFHRDAIALGSVNPLTHLLYGRHLLMRVSGSQEPERTRLAEQARLQLDRVVEIDPDFGEGWALLARAHLVGDAASTAGLRALGKARKLLPGRMDVVETEVQQLLRLERFTEAESLVEGVLAIFAPPAMVDRTREAIARHRLLHAAKEAFDKKEYESGLDYYDRAISATSDLEQKAQMEAQLVAMQEQLQAGDS